MSDDSKRTTVTAPRPWRVEAPNKRYLAILDATGNRVCDLFPFAGAGGRGWDVTMMIAQEIVERANAE